MQKYQRGGVLTTKSTFANGYVSISDGTVVFRILKRTAEFQLNEIDNLPLFQSKPLPLPKRSKLFLEQSLREKNTAEGKQNIFTKSTQQNIVSGFSNQTLSEPYQILWVKNNEIQ